MDALWDPAMKPALALRFPGLTPDQLLEAHSYAYGGAIIQDMGYYPFGSHAFSDLVHYVRSGDFVVALLREANTPDEYAFALGALAHYIADSYGHPMAVNHAVPMLYPKLRRKFGDTMTYEDNPTAHLKTEFGFDVLEAAKQRYAPDAYHSFVGFHVSKELLERAFEQTYAIPLSSLFANVDLALGSYRYSVRSLIPEMTKAAWHAKKDEIRRTIPSMTARRFTYTMSRASFEKEWGHSYERPGLGARILAFFFRLVPKVGPFRALGFKMPTPQAENLFLESFNATVEHYRERSNEVRANNLRLPDRNLDTGDAPLEQGHYRLADQ
ncbi:MAG: zinc dependent phospholipase C family protein, partial [Acidobacteriaceae bacterium]|nr:zinc dependent phospholipase C family protein [Acidobacteriaceae bacterium]